MNQTDIPINHNAGVRTSTLDMIALCREAGLKEPEFRQEGGQFIQTLWRPLASVEIAARSGSKSGSKSGLEWRPELGKDSVHQRIVALLEDGPLSSAEIAAGIGHKSRTRAVRNALAELTAHGIIRQAIPDKPNSRLQKYQLANNDYSEGKKN
jgi:ATP-dependent DNA helicase RecG